MLGFDNCPSSLDKIACPKFDLKNMKQAYGSLGLKFICYFSLMKTRFVSLN